MCSSRIILYAVINAGVMQLKTKSNPIRVLIADGHTKYSNALRQTLDMEDDIEVVGEAENWQSLEVAARQLKPDVILMDMRLSNGQGNNDGIVATGQILRGNPDVAVIVITMLCTQDQVRLARQAGARGFVLKDDRNHELLDTIRVVARPSFPRADRLLNSSVEYYSSE